MLLFRELILVHVHILSVKQQVLAGHLLTVTMIFLLNWLLL